MAVFPVRKFGDPVLRTRSAEVTNVDDTVRRLVTDMFDTMRAASGVGFAAPQLGVGRRVIVWQHDEERGALANPVITNREGAEEGEEGCLSIPGLAYPVVRATHIQVGGLDPDRGPVSFEADGMTARILQHEVDHLDGVLFIDRLDPETAREAKRKLREQAMGIAIHMTEAPAL